MTDFLHFPSWAKVGAKVVCINNEHVSGMNKHPKGAAKLLVVGQEYTISWVGISDKPEAPMPNVASVCLVEDPLSLRTEYTPQTRARWVGRFRPVVSLESDMKMHFERLLHIKEKV